MAAYTDGVDGGGAVGTELLQSLDLANPMLHAQRDLMPVWALLRAQRPVYAHPPISSKRGFWVITRHDDVAAVYRDTASFSSAYGNVLDVMLSGGDSAGGRMVTVSDGTHHGDVRRLLVRPFSPQALAATSTRLRQIARDLLRAAADQGGCDFARDIAAKIPLTAICDLLGVPEADRQHILELTTLTVAPESPQTTSSDSWRAKNEILFYFAELAELRRSEPLADIVTLLAEAAIRGERLADDEVVFNCYSLILGGDETTRLAIVGAAKLFAQDKAAWDALRSGRVSIDTAVEEILRWTTPSMHQARVAHRPVTMHGQRIERGDIITMWNVSANRDERVFDEPEKFRIDRTPNRHLTFATGAHFCIGAHLARLEIAAVLEGLREVVERIELDGTPQPIFSNLLNGFCGLPVRLHPRRR